MLVTRNDLEGPYGNNKSLTIVVVAFDKFIQIQPYGCLERVIEKCLKYFNHLQLRYFEVCVIKCQNIFLTIIYYRDFCFGCIEFGNTLIRNTLRKTTLMLPIVWIMVLLHFWVDLSLHVISKGELQELKNNYCLLSKVITLNMHKQVN